MPDGTATAVLAAEKKLKLIFGSPVVNMWCTHKPNERNPVAMSARTTRR